MYYDRLTSIHQRDHLLNKQFKRSTKICGILLKGNEWFPFRHCQRQKANNKSICERQVEGLLSSSITLISKSGGQQCVSEVQKTRRLVKTRIIQSTLQFFLSVQRKEKKCERSDVGKYLQSLAAVKLNKSKENNNIIPHQRHVWSSLIRMTDRRRLLPASREGHRVHANSCYQSGMVTQLG